MNGAGGGHLGEEPTISGARCEQVGGEVLALNAAPPARIIGPEVEEEASRGAH